MEKRLNILVVGSHPDDIEICCGGTLAYFKSKGHNLYAIVMSCDSKEREKEQQNSFLSLGISTFTFGGFEDGKIPHNKESVSLIDKFIKKKSIDLILTHSEYDAHQDHHNTMKAAMSAGRNVCNFLHFDTVPFKRINYQEFSKPTVYVDITNYIDKKIELIKYHQSQIYRFPNNWEDVIKSEAKYKGNFIDCLYAEAFYCKKLALSSL